MGGPSSKTISGNTVMLEEAEPRTCGDIEDIEVDALCNTQSIFKLDTEIANRAIDFRVAE